MDYSKHDTIKIQPMSEILTGMPQDTASATLMNNGSLFMFNVNDEQIDLFLKGLRSLLLLKGEFRYLYLQ